MKEHLRFTAILLFSTVLLAGCHADNDASTTNTETRSAVPSDSAEAIEQQTSTAADAWLGRWTGVEGTYLQIEKIDHGYRLEIADLDGPQTFGALYIDNQLQFVRDNTLEKITPTDGEGTGMKWLVEKKDCLTVKPGEGFCRD